MRAQRDDLRDRLVNRRNAHGPSTANTIATPTVTMRPSRMLARHRMRASSKRPAPMRLPDDDLVADADRQAREHLDLRDLHRIGLRGQRSLAHARSQRGDDHERGEPADVLEHRGKAERPAGGAGRRRWIDTRSRGTHAAVRCAAVHEHPKRDAAPAGGSPMAAAIAMPVTPSAGRPPRPKISNALSAGVDRRSAPGSRTSPRACDRARVSTAHSAKFIDSRNSVPPIQCR